MTGTHNRAGAKLKFGLCLILLAATAFAADTPEPRWLLLPEPSFMDHQVRRTIPGSDRTILTVARLVDGEIEPLTRDQKRKIPASFGRVVEGARAHASEVLARLEPKFVRDRKGVIEYAVLESDDPLTATAVLAPDFGERFADTLGPEILAAIPNRFQILVFSRQDTAHVKAGELIITGYLSATYPVSREIFEWDKSGLRSLGVYR